jgi:predicted O-linked N-acetylglucosamine transferase (SPINDLY family)
MDLAGRFFSEGLAQFDKGDFAGAQRLFERVLQQLPGNLPALSNLAMAQLRQGDFAGGARTAQDILASQPDSIPALELLATCRNGRNDPAGVLACSERLIALRPAAGEYHGLRGNALRQLARFDEAFAAYDRALALQPDLAGAWLGRGNAFYDLHRPAEALAAHDRALAARPGLAQAWLGRGNALSDLRRHDEAFAAYDRALELEPGMAQAWLGRGNALRDLRRHDEALAAYDHALAADPGLAQAWLGRGNVLALTRRNAEAASAYAKVRQLRPDQDFIKGIHLHQKMKCCDWSGLDALVREIEDDIALGRKAAEPFGWQGLARSEESLQRCARIWNRSRYPAAGAPAPWPSRAGKIRIGYLSGEFREQATSHLIVGLLEAHDRARFEVIGFDNGWDDASPVRRRIAAALGPLAAIRQLDDDAAVAEIRARDIDILVNLNGYFGEERTGIFARRAAPIQVNYLGYPGTLGADYMDYIVADETVLPPGNEGFYDEKVARLPHSYQPNDRARPIGPTPSRRDCGLPADAFVFCCFNNNYKMTPATFDSWMRILSRVENSVLWLFRDNETVADNLRREARRRGVDPARLLFADYTDPASHLARQRLAGLFLDTLPYNAHTTASDALWAGLPVLTQSGNTFAGKVAASLLKAAGLAEMITASAAEYEALAIALALDPARLAGIRDTLERNRLVAPLFDTMLYTRHLEAAYAAMIHRHRAGLKPEDITLPAGARA